MSVVLVATGCTNSPSAEEAASAGLQRRLDEFHEEALEHRARDPAADRGAGTNSLAMALGGELDVRVVTDTYDRDAVNVVVAVAHRSVVGGGLSYEDVTLGTCLAVTATTGEREGEVGERGTVTTRAVHCPPGVLPHLGDRSAERTTVDLRERNDDVPLPRGRTTTCFGRSSDDCAGG